MQTQEASSNSNAAASQTLSNSPRYEQQLEPIYA